MGLQLGRDGKLRALSAAIDGSLWVGLLGAYGPHMKGMTLSQLVASELTPSAFYTGRKPIAFTTISVDASGARALSMGDLVEWMNTGGSDVTVGGAFIATAQSGGTGDVRFVGAPDAGELVVKPGRSIQYVAGDIIVTVD